MFEKPVVWQSSTHVFAEAVRTLTKRSGLVGALILGQFALIAFVWGSTSGALQWIGAVLLYAYQMVFSLVVIHLVTDTEQKSFTDLFFSRIVPKLPAAIALSLIVGIAVVIGTLLLVVPGIILYVYTSLALVVLVAEGTSVGSAIRRSWQYVRGWWWRVCSRIIFTMGLAAILSLISVVPLTGLLVTSVLSIFLAPVVVAYMALTYRELAEKKRLLDAAPVSLGGKLIIAVQGVIVLTLLVVSSIFAQFVINEGLTRRLIAPDNLPAFMYLLDDGSVAETVFPLE